jgi:hypothetical protein
VIPQNRIPGEITSEILALCRELDPTREPVWVPVRAAAGAIPGQDYASLKGHGASSAGRPQFGWIIWENPGWYLEAEFHGVWASPAGELTDIIPRRDGATRLLFLPDSRRTFQGESIPNRFLALSPSPDVQAVVRDAEFHARLRAESETQARRERVAPGGAGRNDPCPCGSGLKYKKCCGRGVR